MNRQRHSTSRLASTWRMRGAMCGLVALMAIPAVGYCSDPDLANPEGLIAYTTQVGVNNASYIAQSGAQDAAYVMQYGAGNHSSITQTGTNNTAVATQYGFGNKAGIIQAGINDYAAVHQFGIANTALVSQYSNNQYANVNQFGIGNKTIVLQVSPTVQPQVVNVVGIGKTSIIIK